MIIVNIIWDISEIFATYLLHSYLYLKISLSLPRGQYSGSVGWLVAHQLKHPDKKLTLWYPNININTTSIPPWTKTLNSLDPFIEKVELQIHLQRKVKTVSVVASIPPQPPCLSGSATVSLIHFLKHFTDEFTFIYLLYHRHSLIFNLNYCK